MTVAVVVRGLLCLSVCPSLSYGILSAVNDAKKLAEHLPQLGHMLSQHHISLNVVETGTPSVYNDLLNKETDFDNKKTTMVSTRNSAASNDNGYGETFYDSPYSRPQVGDRQYGKDALNPDIFGNNTDFTSWLIDIFSEVRRRLNGDGYTADSTALNERPSGDERSTRSFDHTAPTTYNSLMSKIDAESEAKPIPLIVMSGNTYIKDIGNHHTAYKYDPMQFPSGSGTFSRRRVTQEAETGKTHDVSSINENGITNRSKRNNGYDSAGDPMHIGANHQNGGSYKRNYVDDGEPWSSFTLQQQNDAVFLRNVQENSMAGMITKKSDGLIHGHDDGDDGIGKHFPRVHGHDDGGIVRHNNFKLNSFPGVSEHGVRIVHGHDDGDNGIPQNSSRVHGHDDGDTVSANEEDRHTGDNSTSGEAARLVHGHDDGDDEVPRQSPRVHGHDDGDDEIPRLSSRAHGHDDGDDEIPRHSSRVHGHNDGNTVLQSAHLYKNGHLPDSKTYSKQDEGKNLHTDFLNDENRDSIMENSQSALQKVLFGRSAIDNIEESARFLQDDELNPSHGKKKKIGFELSSSKKPEETGSIPYNLPFALIAGTCLLVALALLVSTNKVAKRVIVCNSRHDYEMV